MYELGFGALFSLVRQGELVGLRSEMMHDAYPDGCIDGFGRAGGWIFISGKREVFFYYTTWLSFHGFVDVLCICRVYGRRLRACSPRLYMILVV